MEVFKSTALPLHPFSSSLDRTGSQLYSRTTLRIPLAAPGLARVLGVSRPPPPPHTRARPSGRNKTRSDLRGRCRRAAAGCRQRPFAGGGGGDPTAVPLRERPLGEQRPRRGAALLQAPFPRIYASPALPECSKGLFPRVLLSRNLRCAAGQPLRVKLTGNRSGGGNGASGRAAGAEPLRVPSGGHSPRREPHRSCTTPSPPPRPPLCPAVPGLSALSTRLGARRSCFPPALSSPDARLWF